MLLGLALVLMAAATSSAQGAIEFRAGKYPATVTGSGKLGVFTFGTNGGKVECQNSFDSVLTAASTTMKLAVTYTECKAFGFLGATVTPEGCEFVMHATEEVKVDEYKAHMDLECGAGKSIKISVSTCAMEYKAQTGMTTVRLKDDTSSSPEDVTYIPEVTTGFKYTVTKDGFACPFTGTGEYSDGSIVAPAEGITFSVAETGFQVGEDPHKVATDLQKEVEAAEHSLSTAFPNASKFTAGKYPAIVHGSSSAGVFKIATEGGNLECSNVFFGEPTSGGSSTLDLAVSYESCSISGIGAATVNSEGCGFRLHALENVAKDQYSGRLTLKCGIGESIKITTASCSLELKEQGPLTGVTLTDDTTASPVENVTLKPEVKSVKYTVTKDEGTCPYGGTGVKTNGELTSTANITLTAQSPSVPSEKIAFRVGEHEDLTKHEEKTEKEKTEKEETETPRFRANKYPATVHGSGKVGVFAFSSNGGNIECQNTFHSNLTEASTTMKLAVTYSECKAFGFLTATVTPEGCEFVLHSTEKVTTHEYKAHLGLECPATKSIKVTASTCTAEYKPQTGLTTVKLKDETGATPVEDVKMTPEVTGFKYTVTKDGFACPLTGTGEFSDGKITATEAITLTGQNPSNSSEKIGFRVGTS